MSHSEDLQYCIERCRIGNRSYYVDIRFGTKINQSDLYDGYLDCIEVNVKPVIRVDTIARIDDTFHMAIEIPSLKQTIVKFYKKDKTFACRDYDPSVIIPAILNDPECAEYLKQNNHPYYHNYLADYTTAPYGSEDPDDDASDWLNKVYPECVYSKLKNPDDEMNADLHIEYEDELISIPKYRIREPDSDNDVSVCASCGDDPYESFNEVDEPDENEAMSPTDMMEIERLFGTEQNDSDSELNYSIPKKQLRKLPVKMIDTRRTNTWPIRNATRCEIPQLIEIPTGLGRLNSSALALLNRIESSELKPMSPFIMPDRSIIPRLPERLDNI